MKNILGGGLVVIICIIAYSLFGTGQAFADKNKSVVAECVKPNGTTVTFTGFESSFQHHYYTNHTYIKTFDGFVLMPVHSCAFTYKE